MDHLTVAADDGTSLHVGRTGSGPDVVALSGGPGCVHYLADERLAPRGYRTWFPDPQARVDVITAACDGLTVEEARQ